MEPKPFSNEELKAFKPIAELMKGNSYLQEKGRFLATIAELKRHIELDTAIKKDHRVKMKQQTATIADLKKQAEIKDSLAEGVMTLAEVYEQLEDAKKRIKELEKINKVHRDLRPDETGVLQIIKLTEDVARQAATIERLRDETVSKELLLRYLSQRIRYYDENKFPEWSRALNDAIVKAYTWLKMLIEENKLEGATNDEPRQALGKE